MERFGLEGTLTLILFQTPCHGQGPLPPDHVAQSSIQPGLEPCQGGGSHSFSGQPGPGPHHPHGEEFHPHIQSEPTLFQFKAITPCPIAPCPFRLPKYSSLIKIAPLHIAELAKKRCFLKEITYPSWLAEPGGDKPCWKTELVCLITLCFL